MPDGLSERGDQLTDPPKYDPDRLTLFWSSKKPKGGTPSCHSSGEPHQSSNPILISPRYSLLTRSRSHPTISMRSMPNASESKTLTSSFASPPAPSTAPDSPPMTQTGFSVLVAVGDVICDEVNEVPGSIEGRERSFGARRERDVRGTSHSG